MISQLPKVSSGARLPLLLLAVLSGTTSFIAGCKSAPEPSVRDRRSSFRAQQRAFTGDSIHSILQTFLLIASAQDSPDPKLDPGSGGIFLAPAPQGAFTQGLCVGVDPDGYLLTAGHVLREKNYVVGWMEGRLQIQPARVIIRSGQGDGASELAVIQVERHLDYCARFGAAPAVNDPVFAVVCNRTPSGIGGALDLAGGIVLDGGRDPSGRVRRAIGTDVPLWHGDSGGPLLSGAGDLVGINSAIEFAWFGNRNFLGGFRRLSYFPDEGLVRRVISADKAQAQKR
ncbi:MAG TPA: S1C family serine protease [Opitutaceae bacterium]